jgi:hypothetical protein
MPTWEPPRLILLGGRIPDDTGMLPFKNPANSEGTEDYSYYGPVS